MSNLNLTTLEKHVFAHSKNNILRPFVLGTCKTLECFFRFCNFDSLYCRLFGFIVLHMLMYAANVYLWKRYRINYAFIFGFKQGTELGYREVFLLSSGLAVLALGGVLSNLDMEMDPRTQSFKAITELIPLGLLIVIFYIHYLNCYVLCSSGNFSTKFFVKINL